MTFSAGQLAEFVSGLRERRMSPFVVEKTLKCRRVVSVSFFSLLIPSACSRSISLGAERQQVRLAHAVLGMHV